MDIMGNWHASSIETTQNIDCLRFKNFRGFFFTASGHWLDKTEFLNARISLERSLSWPFSSCTDDDWRPELWLLRQSLYILVRKPWALLMNSRKEDDILQKKINRRSGDGEVNNRCFPFFSRHVMGTLMPLITCHMSKRDSVGWYLSTDSCFWKYTG